MCMYLLTSSLPVCICASRYEQVLEEERLAALRLEEEDKRRKEM